MADHTPSPWDVRGDLILSRVSNSAMRPVAKVYATQMHGKPEMYANARLIAAAPDLLAALKAMVEHFGILEDNPMLHPVAVAASRAARAAIARAEGRS